METSLVSNKEGGFHCFFFEFMRRKMKDGTVGIFGILLFRLPNLEKRLKQQVSKRQVGCFRVQPCGGHIKR
jgi:hypothetical protein